MSRLALLLVVIPFTVLTACTNDNGGSVANNTPMPAAPPDGEQLCDFVPRTTVELALGTTEYDVREGGGVTRDSDDVLVVAGCHIDIDSQRVLDVSVGLLGDGIQRKIFDEELALGRNSQLPDSVGLGYSWVNTSEDGDNESGVGHAWVNYGDYLLTVGIADVAHGRDHEADAVAIAQQVRQTLGIPDEWTLPGEPPARPASST